jgi:hypothetical protein
MSIKMSPYMLVTLYPLFLGYTFSELETFDHIDSINL